MTNEELVSMYRETRENSYREQIIRQNRKLIYYVLKRYDVNESEEDDLFQEASIGLLKAIDEFDSSRGSFSTCAVMYIRGAISRYIDQKVKKYLNVESLNEKISFLDGEVEKIDLLKDDLEVWDIIKDKAYYSEVLGLIRSHCNELEQKAIYLYYYANKTHKEVQESLNIGSAGDYITRGFRKLRKTRWFVDEYNRREEKKLDQKTSWIKSQGYEGVGSGNSHRPFYSPVENLAEKREKIRDRFLI